MSDEADEAVDELVRRANAGDKESLAVLRQLAGAGAPTAVAERPLGDLAEGDILQAAGVPEAERAPTPVAALAQESIVSRGGGSLLDEGAIVRPPAPEPEDPIFRTPRAVPVAPLTTADQFRAGQLQERFVPAPLEELQDTFIGRTASGIAGAFGGAGEGLHSLGARIEEGLGRFPRALNAGDLAEFV